MTTVWFLIETFCLEMQAFPEQLERYKKEKDKV